MDVTPNPNDHIGAAELAGLLEESRGRGVPVRDAANKHSHLAVCSTCREQFEELASLDRQLGRQAKSLRSDGSAARESGQSDCPEGAVWRELAAGPTPADETLVYIKHASQCDHCGRLLRDAVAELSELNQHLTEGERAQVASLESAREEWQQKLARRIAGTSRSQSDRQSAGWGMPARWQRWLSVPRLAVGASILAVVVVGSWVVIHPNELHQNRLYQGFVQRNQPAAATRLLARAYTEKRTLELRIAGAAYAPMHISRGPAASFTESPAALLEAKALIARQLESHPSDASWLQAKAQADLLDGKYDAAVEALHHALELEPDSPALLIDLATAYSQRAQSEDKMDDFAAAYEHLSHALKLRPDDPIALFNRAIVAEHLYLYQQALDDSEHYLRTDPNSQWAEEARNRADAMRERLKKHESQATPLLSPAEIVAKLASGNPPAEVDPRIEEYLQEAVRSWLPQAFPEDGTDGRRGNGDGRASQALFFLADLNRKQQGDRWLADLLRGSSTLHFPQAADALARAVRASDAGEYDVSRTQAGLAETSFRASGNLAGALRAQFEQSYVAQATRRSETCRQRATSALTESEKYPYAWLQIRLELEEGVCSGLMDDLGTQARMAQRAMDQAQSHGYGGLYLRSLYFAADEKVGAGDRSGAWRLSISALQRYWSSEYSWIHAYNLYGGLAFDAESHDQFNLQVALWREVLAVVGSNGNLPWRAFAHESLARAAKAAQQPRLAGQQYAEAERLYALVPQTEASRSNAIDSQIRNAELESHQGQLDNALGRLISVQDQIRPLSNNYLVQMFYSTLGELQLRRHRQSEAEEALQPALTLAEKSLASLASDAERISWKNDAAPVYLALTEAKLLQANPQESLEVYESYLGASQGAASGRSSVPPSGLASRLPLLSRETVLVYAALPDGLAIWVCDDRGVHAEWIAEPTDELQELAARFYELASDPASDLNALHRDGRSLYNALILPVEQRLAPGRTLVIEADGWLAKVPFEALVDAENHYLIERWPVVHSLGQDFEARLRNDNDRFNQKDGAGPIAAGMPLLAVASGASSQREELPPLVGVAEEVDAVASGFRSPRVLKEREATLRTVREDLPSAAVFHFAGHSLVTNGRSGLLLENANAGASSAVSSLLDAAAVRKLNVGNLQLAVLSACSTESGGGGSGGFNSITEAFLRAGVPHVVASRWGVVETRAFIDDFYRSALSGQSVSEAARSASRTVMADRRTAHPYYWSAFAAYGRP